MREGGHNIVFFGPKAAKHIKSSLIKIKDVAVIYEIYNESNAL
jgi:hypothetical protein